MARTNNRRRTIAVVAALRRNETFTRQNICDRVSHRNLEVNIGNLGPRFRMMVDKVVNTLELHDYIELVQSDDDVTDFDEHFRFTDDGWQKFEEANRRTNQSMAIFEGVWPRAKYELKRLEYLDKHLPLIKTLPAALELLRKWKMEVTNLKALQPGMRMMQAVQSNPSMMTANNLSWTPPTPELVGPSYIQDNFMDVDQDPDQTAVDPAIDLVHSVSKGKDVDRGPYQPYPSPRTSPPVALRRNATAGPSDFPSRSQIPLSPSPSLEESFNDEATIISDNDGDSPMQPLSCSSSVLVDALLGVQSSPCERLEARKSQLSAAAQAATVAKENFDGILTQVNVAKAQQKQLRRHEDKASSKRGWIAKYLRFSARAYNWQAQCDKLVEEREALDQRLADLRQQLRNANNQLKEATQLMEDLKKEVEAGSAALAEEQRRCHAAEALVMEQDMKLADRDMKIEEQHNSMRELLLRDDEREELLEDITMELDIERSVVRVRERQLKNQDKLIQTVREEKITLARKIEEDEEQMEEMRIDLETWQDRVRERDIINEELVDRNDELMVENEELKELNEENVAKFNGMFDVLPAWINQFAPTAYHA